MFEDTIRFTSGGLAVASLVLMPRFAPAQEHDDLGCEGTHSLASPLPDVCLGPIDTDRPHQTDTPHVVPAGHVQVESALAEVQLRGSVRDQRGDRSAHVVLFDDNYKVGLVSDVDVQFLFAHAVAAGALLAPGPFELRAKFNIVTERGWIPAISLVPWFLLPVPHRRYSARGRTCSWGGSSANMSSSR